MAKSLTKQGKKKKNSLDKESLKGDNDLSPVPVHQNVDSFLMQKTDKSEVNEKGNINDNGDATIKSKKKKRKKKKTLSESKTPPESGTPLPENEDNSCQSTTDLCDSAEIPELSKLSEITVIKLPQPVQPDAGEVDNKPIEAVNDTSTTTNTSKKKKKKQKKVADNNDDNKQKVAENTQTQPDNSSTNNSIAPCTSIDTPVTSNPSYFKVSQSHNSTVFLVSNPADDANKNNSMEMLPKNTPATITMGPDSRCVVRNTDHMNLQNQLLEQMGKCMFPQLGTTQPSGFVSVTPVVDGKQTSSAQDIQSNLGTNCEDTTQKTKAQLKAERRAIQEAQRAAKEASRRASNIIENHQILSKPASSKPMASVKTIANTMKSQKESYKNFFSHLPQFKSLASLEKHLQSDDYIHPSIISVGSQYAKNNVVDPNKYCTEVLLALKNVIEDYKTPPNKELRRDLGTKLEKSISFLTKCRPFPVGTSNALKFLKLQIGNVPEGQTDDKAKETICEQVDKFIQDSVCLAVEAISKIVSSEINDDDVILTYGYSSVVKNALCEAQQQGKHFKVVVIDSRPTLEGRYTLSSFLKESIPCSYALMSALSYVMKEVTKVIIGAHAVQASSYVMSRVGSSQVALLASAYNIPFLVCCETYKFCDRALIDSFIDNELGDPENFTKLGLTQANTLENWKEIPCLNLINLQYDITPPHLISKIITEKCH